MPRFSFCVFVWAEKGLVCFKKCLRNLKKLVYKFKAIGYNKFTSYTLCDFDCLIKQNNFGRLFDN